MSGATSENSSKEKGQFSPFAGCSIFIIAGLLAIGMISFTFWMGTRVESTIQDFTQDDSKEIELVDTADKQREQVALKSKLVGFRHQIEAGKTGKITLNTEEINLAIATFDILKPQRENLHVSSISDEGLRAEISNPINSKMSNIISADKTFRYLNGTILIQPELVENAVFPRITTIKPDGGGSVPTEFTQQISKTLLAPFKDDEEIGPLFSSISSVEIKDELIILKTDPKQPRADTADIDQQPVIERFMKGFSIVAIVFLAIIAGIIILSRRKAKADQS